MHQAAQIRPVHKFHGEKQPLIFSPFQVPAVHHVLVPHLAQHPALAQKAARKGLIAVQLVRQKFQRPRRIHQLVPRQVNRAHSALAQQPLNPIGLADQHSRPQVDNLAQRPAMGGAGHGVVGIAGIALWADFHRRLDPMSAFNWFCHCDSQVRLWQTGKQRERSRRTITYG